MNALTDKITLAIMLAFIPIFSFMAGWEFHKKELCEIAPNHRYSLDLGECVANKEVEDAREGN